MIVLALSIPVALALPLIAAGEPILRSLACGLAASAFCVVAWAGVALAFAL